MYVLIFFFFFFVKKFSYLGGYASGEPDDENKSSWMAYITQAGVALGLAKKVHLEYSGWGGAFATTMISVVVINQIIGPPFFRYIVEKVKRKATRVKQ
eukprot:GSMAST32.ASY1.ANO1.710.1 assembled CDS